MRRIGWAATFGAAPFYVQFRDGSKSDPVSLDTVWTTMTAAKEAGHEGQGAKANHDSWQ
jgi:hypothetical protein